MAKRKPSKTPGQRLADMIAGRGMLAAESLASEVRRKLVDQIGTLAEFVNTERLLVMARELLDAVAPDMAQGLAETDLAAWLAGYHDGARGLPKWAEQMLAEQKAGGGMRPPRAKVQAVAGEDPSVRFPLIENAVESLERRGLMTREQFDAASDYAQSVAFTVAKTNNVDTIGKLRDALVKTVRSGTSLENYREAVGEALGGSPIAPHHLENVYRTNVQAAFRDGRETMAANPVVAAVFPYQQYHATHDARTRPEHLALATLGLNGTAIYRRDDPFWDSFTPPWGFNSIATGELLTTARGDVPIELVQVGDVVLTHLGNWRPVLGTHCAKGPSEIVVVHADNGRSMRLTAEHRVFTENGWIESACLQEGNKIHQVANPVSVDLLRRIVNDGPQSKHGSDVLVPVHVRPDLAALQFNTDTNSGNVEIKPVWRRGGVEGELDSAEPKRFGKYRFASRHAHAKVQMCGWIDKVTSFSGGGNSCANIWSARWADEFEFGGERRRSFGVPFVMQASSLGQIAPLNSIRHEQSTDRTINNSSCPGNVCDTDIASLVRGYRGRVASGPSSIDSLLGLVPIRSGAVRLLSGHKTPMNSCVVTSVQRQLYRGLVHDVSVAGDESFVINGMAVSNCRCGVILTTIRQAAAMGVQEAQRWLETGQPPERPEWRFDKIPFPPEPGFGSRGRVIARAM